MKTKVPTALEQLNLIIDETVSHISDFTRNPGDFTRKRKLDATTTIKVMLNMEGQSLNTELINAFPDMNDRMTTSAFEQHKAKLTPELFMKLFTDYNNSILNYNLFDNKYELYAVDGSDFNIPYQKKSKYAVNIQNGRPRKDGEPTKPFSQLHGNMLFNISDRTYQDIIIQSKTHSNERSAAIEMLERLHPSHPYIIALG